MWFKTLFLSLYFVLLLWFGPSQIVLAEVYQTQEAFLQVAFKKAPFTQSRLWLKDADQQVAKAILGHPYAALRVRYWHHGNKTAWIMEEIGKERPITIGVVVNEKQIEYLNILAFRESRGWEVKYPFFKNQFKGVSLKEEYQLSQHIDGITGATLSVRAVKGVAAFALYLHHKVVVD